MYILCVCVRAIYIYKEETICQSSTQDEEEGRTNSSRTAHTRGSFFFYILSDYILLFKSTCNIQKHIYAVALGYTVHIDDINLFL